MGIINYFDWAMASSSLKLYVSGRVTPAHHGIRQPRRAIRDPCPAGSAGCAVAMTPLSWT